MEDQKTTIVKACIRNENGEFLVVQRSPEDKLFPDAWDLPGGRIDVNETAEEAVRRKVSEEVALEIEAAEEMATYDLVDKDTALEFIVFDAAVYPGDVVINLEEYSDFKWASMVEILESKHAPFLDLFFSEFPDVWGL